LTADFAESLKTESTREVLRILCLTKLVIAPGYLFWLLLEGLLYLAGVNLVLRLVRTHEDVWSLIDVILILFLHLLGSLKGLIRLKRNRLISNSLDWALKKFPSTFHLVLLLQIVNQIL
jgi:hypothetical protein